jgi:hypothetical protein
MCLRQYLIIIRNGDVDMNIKMKRFKLLAAMLAAITLSACGNSTVQNLNEDTKQVVSTNDSSSEKSIIVTSEMISYDKDDDYSDWKNENPTYIELNKNSAAINGAGAVVKESKITIIEAGTYVFSGKLENGQIIVDVENEEIVKLVLNGVEISCSDNAPIYVKNAEKTIISLPEGTQNIIMDGSEYVFSDSLSDEPSAAIFSKDDLSVNGTGELTVRANYKDGIVSKDDLKINGGNIDIVSTDDGLIGRDKVLIKEGNITITAGGDGIKTTNDTDDEKGFIAFDGGVFDIKAGADGIQAETSVLITDGEFTIFSGGGSENGHIKVSDDRKFMPEKQENTLTSKTSEVENQSKKAIKAVSDITINGGTINIDSADDAVHSNNSINIAGGDITITSGDDGIHADSSITIKDGKIDIKKSYEGIESMLVAISGGETHIISSDDGINVAGGNDGSAVNGRPGQNKFGSSGNNNLRIDGGYVMVDALGDGLDANGSIYMTNGIVIVNGPIANNNGALDYDGEFEISGGLLVAAGSAGMAQAPSDQSNQKSILMYYSDIQKANTLIHLEDSNGNTVMTFAPKKDYQSVVISSPVLKENESYTLYTGGTLTGDVSEGINTNGNYQGGTKVVDFTINSSVIYLSEEGITTQRGFNPGKGGNPGFEKKQQHPEFKGNQAPPEFKGDEVPKEK